MIADIFYQIGESDQSAREQYPVYMPLEDGCHLSDAFAELIAHGMPYQSGVFVASVHHLMHGIRVGCAEVAHEAACAGEHDAQLLRGMPLLEILTDLQQRYTSESGRRKGSVSSRALGAVYHASLFMCRDRDAAVDMRYDEAAVLVLPAQLFGMYLRDSLLIEHMGLRSPVYSPDARGSCLVAQLVHIGRIERIHLSAVLPAQLIGEHDTELGRMIASAYTGGRISHQSVIDDGDARRLRVRAAAPADKYVYLRRINAVLL